jgi:pimeloyl-ACP methyl ester carboxylesterase
VVEAGDRGASVVVLAHGFPELAYSWRHQIPVLADAGYHVLAPDQRGYGGSSRPDAIEAYNIHELTADLVGLLDDVGAERAVWVGHDWGAIVVWNMPLLHPDRVAAVAALSVPRCPAHRRRRGRFQNISARIFLHPLFPGLASPMPNSTVTLPARCAG